MNSRLLFFTFFVFITVFEITADLQDKPLLVYLLKPLIVLSLILYFVSKKKMRNIAGYGLFLTGLVFALLGDSFLMYQEKDLFIAGLASFLVMQILYSLAFSTQIKYKLTTAAYLIKLPFIAFGLVLYLVLEPHLQDVTMKIAVAVYAYSIATMAWMSLLRRKQVTDLSYKLVFSGALLFMISDSLIAIDRFLNPIPFNTIWVMGSYAAAQYLITIGFLKTNQAG